MNILVMGQEEKEALWSLRKYAEENMVTMDMMLDQMNGERTPVGDMEDHCRYIPDSYKVVYSIEEQPPGPARHVSVSCNLSIPPVEAVGMIIKELGFVFDPRTSSKESRVHVYTEDGPDGKKAINIIEVI